VLLLLLLLCRGGSGDDNVKAVDAILSLSPSPSRPAGILIHTCMTSWIQACKPVIKLAPSQASLPCTCSVIFIFACTSNALTLDFIVFDPFSLARSRKIKTYISSPESSSSSNALQRLIVHMSSTDEVGVVPPLCAVDMTGERKKGRKTEDGSCGWSIVLNFFDIGGDSLMLISRGLNEALASTVESVDRVCAISMMNLGALENGSGMVIYLFVLLILLWILLCLSLLLLLFVVSLALL
jgi:hypothetical protein